jgi:AAA15 family ATPase/GTPase
LQFPAAKCDKLPLHGRAAGISLVATKLKDSEAGLLKMPAAGDLKALPSALIYGAKASGKTNFVKAFSFR